MAMHAEEASGLRMHMLARILLPVVVVLAVAQTASGQTPVPAPADSASAQCPPGTVYAPAGDATA
jgi:Flp pilus assembly protein CpaB